MGSCGGCESRRGGGGRGSDTKAVDVSAAEAKAERDRPAALVGDGEEAQEAATARDKALSERLERPKAAAEKWRRRRLAEGRSEEVAADPDRVTRATAAHAMRVASDTPDRGLFDSRPAVQYVQHRATPSWTSGVIR